MKIAIDIDDTLTDSVDYFRPFVAEYFGVTTGELKKEIFRMRTFPKSGNRVNSPFTGLISIVWCPKRRSNPLLRKRQKN